MSHSITHKLYIYIPTYNREVELKLQIEALLRASKYIDSSQVIIHINDNDSTYITDNVKALCKENNIKYTKNTANLGGNANILLGFLQPLSAEYLWILSDNDIVEDQSLTHILSALDTKPDLMLATSLTADPKIGIFNYEANILDLLDNRAGLISSTIYNLRTINNHIAQAFFYHNSSFPHLGVIFATLREHKSIKVSLVPSANVLRESIEIADNRGDYRLAYLGFPMLAELLDHKSKKLLINGWFKQNSLYLIGTYNYNKYLYYASLKSILRYGSYRIKIKAIILDFVKHIIILVKRLKLK